MGLGTKIKEALNGDSHRRHYSTADTSRTPGSFPSDEVPRSIGHDSAYDSHNSDSETKAEKEADKYTYGSTRSRREPKDADVTEDKKVGGVTRSGTTGGTGTAKLQGKRLNKGNKEPYWGDADATGVSGVGAAADTSDRTGNISNAQDINDRYKTTAFREEFSVDTPIDQSVRGDDDELAPTGRSGQTLEDQGLGHQGLDHRYEPTRDLEASKEEANLVWRPQNSAAHTRDAKVDEYGAPTNSVGRSKPSMAGVAAAGLAATRLADRHHEADLREEEEALNTSRWGSRGGGDTYDMASPRMTGVETGMLGRSFNNTTNTAAPGMNHTTGGTYGKQPSTMGPGFGRGEGFGAEKAEDGRGLVGAMDQAGHFGPGHQGAKVMHRCYNCGADNDITKHFRQDAVYRMS